MRVKYLIDAEPYKKGDVIDRDADTAAFLIENGTAKQVDEDTPIYVEGVTPTGGKTPEEIKHDQLQRTADNAGRDAAMTGPDGEPKGEVVAPSKGKKAAKETAAEKKAREAKEAAEKKAADEAAAKAKADAEGNK